MARHHHLEFYENQERQKRMIRDAYLRIASGEITVEDAIHELGYNSFSCMEDRRRFFRLPTLTDLGVYPHRKSIISEDEIAGIYHRIAMAKAEGKDIREEEAHAIGFKSFESMDKKRADFLLPSLRECYYGICKDEYEKAMARKQKKYYRAALERKRAARERGNGV